MLLVALGLVVVVVVKVSSSPKGGKGSGVGGEVHGAAGGGKVCVDEGQLGAEAVVEARGASPAWGQGHLTQAPRHLQTSQRGQRGGGHTQMQVHCSNVCRPESCWCL